MVEPLPVLARLLQYAGATILGGAPLFCLYALPGAEGRAFSRRAWPRAAFALASLLVLIGGVVALGLETADMSGAPGDAYRPEAIWTVVRSTAFGHGMGARLALSAPCLVIGALPPSRGQWSLLALLGAGVLASFAWTGHGGSDDGAAGLVHRGADIVHLYAAGVWLGALAVLGVLLAGGSSARDAPLLHRALARFSGMGTLAVALLVLTGLINSWFLIGPAHLEGLIRTGYGLVLLAKVGAFAAMLAFAARNRFTLTPRLGGALDQPAMAVSGLRRSVRIETGLAALVLTLVAVLGLLPPAAMV